jgi:hypothetical protein
VVAHHEVSERLLVTGTQPVEQQGVRIDHAANVWRASGLVRSTFLSIELAAATLDAIVDPSQAVTERPGFGQPPVDFQK